MRLSMLLLAPVLALATAATNAQSVRYAATYVPISLPADYSFDPLAFGNNGEIAGGVNYFDTTSNIGRTVAGVWHNGQMSTYDFNPQLSADVSTGGFNHLAASMSGNGQAVFRAAYLGIDELGGQSGYFRSYAWTNGSFAPVGGLGTMAYTINNAGDIGGNDDQGGFVYRADGQVLRMQTSDPEVQAYVTSVNNVGQILGQEVIVGPEGTWRVPGNNFIQDADGTRVTLLPADPDQKGAWLASPPVQMTGLSDSGQVVLSFFGADLDNPNQPYLRLLVYKDGQFVQLLGSPSLIRFGRTYLDPAGRVLGSFTSFNAISGLGASGMFVWEDGHATLLTDLLDNPDLVIDPNGEILAGNGLGEVLVMGYNTRTGESGVFKLSPVPVPEPGTYALIGLGLLSSALVARRRT